MAVRRIPYDRNLDFLDRMNLLLLLLLLLLSYQMGEAKSCDGNRLSSRYLVFAIIYK
jgi:hypothetical protein